MFAFCLQKRLREQCLSFLTSVYIVLVLNVNSPYVCACVNVYTFVRANIIS